MKFEICNLKFEIELVHCLYVLLYIHRCFRRTFVRNVGWIVRRFNEHRRKKGKESV